ncbi:HlyD family efflux transporter periplasmic adaptor subunit [Trichococcus pasteurii]|nr:biotin/lipoyl-binding protein [Trichococcus pasteurii]
MGKLKAIIFKSKKSIIVTAVLLLTVLAGGGTAYWWYQNAQVQEVSLQTAWKGQLAKYVPITGDIEASSRSSLYPSPTAKIVEVLAVEGQAVKKGEVLARIDSTEYRTQLDKQTINLANAEATLAYLSGSSAEMDKSSSQNAVSQAQIALESAQSNAAALADKLNNVEIANANAVGQAELTLENAKAHYWIAKKNLDDLENAMYEAECSLETAKAAYASAKLNLDIVKALYDADPILYAVDYQLAQQAVNIAETAVWNAELALDSAEMSYKAGYDAAKLAVIDAETAVHSAEITLSNAKNAADAEYAAAEKAVSDSETAVRNAEIALSNAESAGALEYAAAEKAVSDSEAAVRNAEITLSNARSGAAVKYEAAVKAISDGEKAVRSAGIALSNLQTTASFSSATTEERISNQADQIALLKTDIVYLNKKIEECDLKANVDGVVTKMDVVANEYPQIGDAIIVDGATEYVISLAVSQYDSVNMRVGQKANVKVKGLIGEYKGIVSEIGQSAEKSATSADQDAKVAVKVTITDPDENIKVGYEADAEIITIERLDALRVNYEAVQIEAESGKAYVYVVDSSNRVEKRYIETGLETEYDIEILDGLVEGERYVADPDKEPVAGVKVRDSGDAD